MKNITHVYEAAQGSNIVHFSFLKKPLQVLLLLLLLSEIKSENETTSCLMRLHQMCCTTSKAFFLCFNYVLKS